MAQVPGELAHGGRLAGPVDAGHQDHGRLGPQIDSILAGPRDPGQEGGQSLRQRLAAREIASGGLALELRHHLRRRPRAHVGIDQRLFQPFPGLVAEVLEQRRLDFAAQRLPGLAQALAQPAEPAGSSLCRGPGGSRGGCRRRHRCAIDDEQVLPLSRHCGARRYQRARAATDLLRPPLPPVPAGARSPSRSRPRPSRPRTASRRPPSCASGG